jgi:hypothetical protein
MPYGGDDSSAADHAHARKSALFIIVDIALARIIHEVSAASADTRL